MDGNPRTENEEITFIGYTNKMPVSSGDTYLPAFYYCNLLNNYQKGNGPFDPTPPNGLSVCGAKSASVGGGGVEELPIGAFMREPYVPPSPS